MAPPNVALVTGASGITGRHLVDALLRRRQGHDKDGQAWRVVTLARRDLEGLSAEDAKGVTQAGGQGCWRARAPRVPPCQQVKADLMDRAAVEKALRDAGVAGEGSVTHIFHCAYIMKDEPAEESEVNLRMLRSVVEAVEATGGGGSLKHVYCMEGALAWRRSRWYGQQLHVPLKTPHREDDPPIPPPMFYFSLQGYLEERVIDGAAWSWSALRPNPVCGFSTGSFMNITTSIAVYASVCKELGLPMRFPGGEPTYGCYIEMCDADVLAEAMVHCATTPACANRAFNVSNGDVFRWRDLWPKIAACFGLEVAQPMAVPLAKVMADKGPVWDALVKKHGLQEMPMDRLATWAFADFVMSYPGDLFANHNALARTGFHGMCLDTDEMFARLFRKMREQRVIP
ncbi:hypothetical protein ABPG75_001984 [Micractinium tetrahymenae]